MVTEIAGQPICYGAPYNKGEANRVLERLNRDAVLFEDTSRPIPVFKIIPLKPREKMLWYDRREREFRNGQMCLIGNWKGGERAE